MIMELTFENVCMRVLWLSNDCKTFSKDSLQLNFLYKITMELIFEKKLNARAAVGQRLVVELTSEVSSLLHFLDKTTVELTFETFEKFFARSWLAQISH